jgi:hypothetical protein
MRKGTQALAALLLGAGLIGGGGTALAHHSFAVFFDESKDVTISGTVKSFRFTNPHGVIVLETTQPQAGQREWRVETNAPVVLMRRGWTRDSLKPGDQVTIQGWPARDGKPYMRLRAARDGSGKLIGQAPFTQAED